ncbi:MAG: transglycosylase SLT domain-containing protein [Pseudomonadales bacterium]
MSILQSRCAGRALAMVALLAVATACTSAPAEQVDESGLNTLYAGIESASQRYQEGLQALRDGHPEAGHLLMESAAADLAAGGNACTSTPGCEAQRFLAAYQTLLSLRSDGFTEAAEHPLEPEANLIGDSPILSHLPEAGRSINLLNGHELADIIKINGPVKAALHDWLTWMRPQLIDTYENYQFMRHLMWPAYEQAGLPEALLFGILAKESGGRVHSTSHAGAAGPFQFMYHTGLRFGLRRDNGFDSRFDPAASARANVDYLNEQFRVLNNNLELALAAYNSGEGRMRRLYQQSRGKSFWSPEIIGQLPRETQEYVPYVLAAAWLFLHPEEHGLTFPQFDTAPGEIRLSRSTTLYEVAVCIGQSGSRNGWFRALRNLNPSLEPHRELPADTVLAAPAAVVDAYARQCVDGPLVELAASLQAARQPGSIVNAGGRPYVVKSGDSLDSIARRFRCPSAQAIARSNSIAAPRYLIRPGQQLLLVGCAG